MNRIDKIALGIAGLMFIATIFMLGNLAAEPDSPIKPPVVLEKRQYIAGTEISYYVFTDTKTRRSYAVFTRGLDGIAIVPMQTDLLP